MFGPKPLRPISHYVLPGLFVAALFIVQVTRRPVELNEYELKGTTMGTYWTAKIITEALPPNLPQEDLLSILPPHAARSPQKCPAAFCLPTGGCGLCLFGAPASSFLIAAPDPQFFSFGFGVDSGSGVDVHQLLRPETKNGHHQQHVLPFATWNGVD